MNPAAATLARSRRGPAMLALLSTSNATASRTRPSAENSTICCGTLLSRIRKSSGFKPVAGRPSRFLTHTSKGTRSTPLLNCGRSAGAFAALPRAREPVDHESTAWACPDAVLSTISASARGARRMLKWRSGVMPVQQVSPIYFPAKSCDQQTLSGILLLCHRAIRPGLDVLDRVEAKVAPSRPNGLPARPLCDRNAHYHRARSPRLPATGCSFALLILRWCAVLVSPASEGSPVLFELGEPTKGVYGTYFAPTSPSDDAEPRQGGSHDAHFSITVVPRSILPS